MAKVERSYEPYISPGWDDGIEYQEDFFGKARQVASNLGKMIEVAGNRFSYGWKYQEWPDHKYIIEHLNAELGELEKECEKITKAGELQGEGTQALNGRLLRIQNEVKKLFRSGVNEKQARQELEPLQAKALRIQLRLKYPKIVLDDLLKKAKELGLEKEGKVEDSVLNKAFTIEGRAQIMLFQWLKRMYPHIQLNDVHFKSSEKVTWPDQSLGCGGIAVQALTPGFRISFEYKGKKYYMHTDEAGRNIGNPLEGRSPSEVPVLDVGMASEAKGLESPPVYEDAVNVCIETVSMVSPKDFNRYIDESAPHVVKAIKVGPDSKYVDCLIDYAGDRDAKFELFLTRMPDKTIKVMLYHPHAHDQSTRLSHQGIFRFNLRAMEGVTAKAVLSEMRMQADNRVIPMHLPLK